MSERYLVFTGRPNSGKSIIIRKITGLKTRSGKRPGTTRRVSAIPLSQGLSLVDMPGYGRITGAAKDFTENVKDDITGFIEEKGDEIVLAVHVLDLSTFMEVALRQERKGLIPIDQEMIHYLRESTGEPPLVAANKIDKVGGKRDPLLEELRLLIASGDPSEPECPIFPVSAKTGEGMGALKDAIHRRLVEEGFRTPFRS
ncbi:GTP-binding protein EngB [archaeon]|nr:GTP-binding protein EngB [archaeon]